MTDPTQDGSVRKSSDRLTLLTHNGFLLLWVRKKDLDKHWPFYALLTFLTHLTYIYNLFIARNHHFP